MNKDRKKEIINFCIQVAKDEFNKELSENQKTEKMNNELNKIHPNPIEFAMMIDLVDEYIEKVKKGEI